MIRVKKIINSKLVVMMVWIIGIIAIWEIGATNIEQTKRTPENILPHSYQIVESVFSHKIVANGLTATQVVLKSAKATLYRAFLGFLVGTIIGFALALLMKMSHLVEKTMFPYLMLIQMIPIIGMAPIILAITQNIRKSRIVIAA